MRLAHQIFGEQTSLPTLVIVPGLFGHGRNWGVIARRLAESRRVVTLDQRNHGDSPWDPDHSYSAMAHDLAELIEALGAPVDLAGHSMGGKASMVLALTRPDLLRRLVIADIAPVAYTHTQAHLIAAMRAIGTEFASRKDAEAALAEHVPEPVIRTFLLQSLDLKEQRWKLNLDALEAWMPQILSFPEITGSFDGPTLFLTGAESNYVRPEHRYLIKSLFPKAKFAKIPGAGHWLHAEKPREVEETLRVFLTA